MINFSEFGKINSMKSENLKVQDSSDNTKYTYSATSESFLDGIFVKHIVKPMLKLIPYGIPANIITIFSNSLVILSFIIAMQATRGSHFLWFLIPIFITVYVIGDSLDGEQARRTKTGSPLGEFMDHFLDTFVTGVLIISMAVSYGITNPFVIYISLFISYTTQGTAFWEKYRTHRMVFGKFSSSETILTFTLIITLAGITPIHDALCTRLSEIGFIQNSFLSSYPAVLNMNIMAVIMLVMDLVAIGNITITLIRCGGASAKYWLHLLLAGITAVFFMLSDIQFLHIPPITYSFLNIDYISSLLVSIVEKKKDPWPDFILPAASIVIYFMHIDTPLAAVLCLVFIMLRIVIRVTAFIVRNRKYWVWKNPAPVAESNQ